MRTYPTEKFTWEGVEAVLKPNQHLPERFYDLYINGERKGIYDHREARLISKQLLALAAATNQPKKQSRRKRAAAP